MVRKQIAEKENIQEVEIKIECIVLIEARCPKCGRSNIKRLPYIPKDSLNIQCYICSCEYKGIVNEK